MSSEDITNLRIPILTAVAVSIALASGIWSVAVRMQNIDAKLSILMNDRWSRSHMELYVARLEANPAFAHNPPPKVSDIPLFMSPLKEN